VKPRLLDLFSGAGGSAVGYHRAGFEVVGVDLAPQPRYPFEFHQADALTFPLDGFDAIHASPPCHDHSSLSSLSGLDAIHASPPCHDHSSLSSLSGLDGTGDLLARTRVRLASTGLPWVIENVPGAPMRADVLLCGEMFGLRTYRHRRFELSGFFALTPAHPPHRVRTSSKKRRACWDAGLHVSVTGDVGTYVGSQAMGIDWMTGNELSQAIPPAYTEHIGCYLRRVLADRSAA
jgi:DNA (cytosine-5)-methyltransferase 1